MSGIFISYRRSDASGYAGRLYEHLAKHFGKQRVFMDIDTLQPGLDFGQALDAAVSGCDVLVALIGPNWLRATDADGNRRLDNPDDFVRLEIGAALAREGVRVIPVLVGHADLPHASALPDELKPLARRHSVELSDQRWDFDVGRLVARLETVVAPARKRIAAPPSSRRLLAIGGPAILAIAALLFTIGPLRVFGGGENPDPSTMPAIAADPPTPDPTQPPTPKSTDPPTPEPMDPPTPESTATPTPTAPPSPTPTATVTPTDIPTPTPTATPTPEPTDTPEPTATSTPTPELQE
ncbi:MAG TPA: toll/interleukin-1 receptor domain-containing protein, partial [Mycobacterium sp.]|nr:toll/interleukin-1 receptor domain-containing protein [Mycobacterium sp.]